MALTNKQKAALAGALMDRAGTLLEFWDEMAPEYGIEDIPADDAARQLGRWLFNLPGDKWHSLLIAPID